MAVRFKTDEELLATGWRRMTRDEVLNSTSMEELADEPCFAHPDSHAFFVSRMREFKFKQGELDEVLKSEFDCRTLEDPVTGAWTVSSTMLVEDNSTHTCEPVNVSLFFATMACKTCGRSM